MPVLHWINDADARRAAAQVPFHLLERKAVYGNPDQAEKNLIVHGDNLVALKALLPFYKGKVKCIYIDPPYNTGSAFEHYDDNLEHSQWLSMMMPRLQLLRDFLRDDGSIWLSLDDNEAHYARVLLDEVFGRKNFVVDIAWEKSDSPRMDAQLFSTRYDHILLAAKDITKLNIKKVQKNDDDLKQYNKVDLDGREYYLKPFRFMGSGADTREARPSMYYPLTAPDGSVIYPIRKDGTDGRWRWSLERYNRNSKSLEWVNSKGKWVPYTRVYKPENGVFTPPETWFPKEICDTNRQAKSEINKLFEKQKKFDTPKPERLIQYILSLSTDKGDLVLDSFLGSGTTAAVAHKLERAYIGVEQGEQANSLCVPRLTAVIDGEQGGISESVNWQGGGGFSFYELSAPVFDRYGAINPQVTFETLASYVWQCETGCAGTPEKKPLLGVREGVGIYLLYNGVLGDKRPEAGNVLTPELLESLLVQYPHDGPKVIYAEAMIGIDDLELRERQIAFKQIPYDIRD